LTEGISLRITPASSTVKVGTVPDPIRSPPLVELPDRTIRRFEPMLAMCSVIWAFAPKPTAIMAMTALTPMTIPSTVKTERILLTMRARNAIRRLAKRVVTSSVFLYRQEFEIISSD
jgi:hypothetical protein